MEDLFVVTFAGNDLGAIAGVDVVNHNFNNMPRRDIKINKLARQDLSIITSAEYQSKEITVVLKVAGMTRTATEESLKLLKARVQAQNAPLVTSQTGIKVEYTATVNAFEIEWFNPLVALVTISFIASDPIGRGVLVENLAAITGQTAALVNVPITVDGSVYAKPSITVVLNSVSGGSNTFIQLLNGATGQGIKITATWAAGDTLIVDSSTMQASINGDLVDFTGMFPVFKPGVQQIKYNDGLTARNFDLSATYKPRIG